MQRSLVFFKDYFLLRKNCYYLFKYIFNCFMKSQNKIVQEKFCLFIGYRCILIGFDFSSHTKHPFNRFRLLTQLVKLKGGTLVE